MAYVKTIWSTGDTITATLANHWETQYDEAKADLDAKMNETTGHKHTGTIGDAPKIALADTTGTINDTQHGNRSGGSLHALVTTIVHGFMAAADKNKLDGIEAGATADQTASEILNAIKTVDGAGSLLDADTLDGQHASAFAPLASFNTHLANNIPHIYYGTTGGVADAYTVTLSPVPTAYSNGFAVSIKIHATNTGISTLNVNGLGIKTIKKSSGDDVGADDLLLDSVYTLRYNGTNFILQGESGVKINGQTEEICLLGEAISKNDPVYVNLKEQSKLANPATIPTGLGNGVTFSPDGVYMTVAHNITPRITIYKRSGDVFTKLANPATLPTGDCNAVAFSSDLVYMAVAHAVSPFITIYKRSGDVFTKLANPATLPTGTGYGVTFSPDGVYMAVAHGANPYITIYKRSGDVFTKLANPATLPPNNGYGIAFSQDGVYVAVAHPFTPFVTIYKRSGDVFTKLANPATLPSSHGYGVAFSQDGVYMAVSHDITPFIAIYKRSGDVFTKLASPVNILPTGTGYGVAFSPDRVYMAVAHDSYPYITIYKRSGDVFTKLANPATLPVGIGTGVDFSPDSVYLAVADGATPYVIIYKNIFEAFISNVGNWRTAAKVGYAKEAGLVTESKKMIITHR